MHRDHRVLLGNAEASCVECEGKRRGSRLAAKYRAFVRARRFCGRVFPSRHIRSEMSDIAKLLAEADWLTRLAQSLVGRDDADDIVQETYVAALRKPPDPDRPARPWLRRVMVNVVRMRHRGRVRRDAREQAVISAEIPTPEQALERARVERTLANLVLALEEPMRSTVLLRYREGLSPEAIAAQQHISVRTVRRRLQEGVARLRVGMDGREDSKTWRAAFAPFLVPRNAAPVPWRGGLVFKKVLAIVAILIASWLVGRKVVGKSGTSSSETASSSTTPLSIVKRVVATAGAMSNIVEEDLVPVPGCVHLRGTISDSSGAPIPHARVSARPSQGARAKGVDADDSGHYDLCAHFGTLIVDFTAIGFSGITTRVTFAADETRDVTLLPEAVIAGTVVTTDGTPVAGAEVVVDPLRKISVMVERPVKVTTDAAGAFRIGGISPGRNVLSANAAGLWSRSHELVIGAGETREHVVLRMAPGGRITGRVVDHGRPVAGAGVTVRSPSTLHAGILTTTAADGSFAIDRAPKGHVGMIVDLFHVEAPASVEVGDAETHVVIEVSALGTIEGTVTSHGAPVADAVVGCPATVANNIADVTTQADGRYRCAGFKAGTFNLLARDVNGRWGDAHGSIQHGETKTVDIDLANNGMLCGTVKDKLGAPVGGLLVRANDATQADSGVATTSDDGSFCVGELLDKGSYLMSAALDGQAIELHQPAVALEHRADVALVVDLQFSTIAGTVVDSAGAPVPDAVIRSSPINANSDFVFDSSSGSVTLTDDLGHFALKHLPVGNYRIFALGRDGSATGTDAITTGTTTVRIVLAAAGAIEGKLVGFTTPPIVMGTLMTGGRENVDFEVDGSTFRATGLPPGDYTLQADTFGRDADSHRVTVKSGETTHVTLTSRGTATINGTVVAWKTNGPLANVRCNPPVATENGNVGGVYNLVDAQTISDAQ
ncbi:MAG: sigma-70 family RNA polymerase sigma factor, partial [Deltaproteobacteria bacterium]